MAATHTATTLDAMWKQTYADELKDLVPETAKLTKQYAFKEGQKIGDVYRQPVVVAGSHGFSRGRGAITLNAAIVSVTADAQLDPFPLYLREVISYDAAARMVKSNQTFVFWSKHLVSQMFKAMYNQIEVEMLYGKSPTGLATADTCTNPSGGTTLTLTCTAASWSAIFAGKENAQISLFKSTDLTVSGGLLNANAAVVVTAINDENRTLAVSGNSTDMTAIYNHLSGSPGGGDAYIFWYASSTTTAGDLENPGFDAIITNTGTLFNINAATYALWKGHSVAASGAISRSVIKKANAKAASFGLTGDCTCWVSPKAFAVLEENEAGLSRFNGSGAKKAVNGFGQLSFNGQTGLIKVEAHPCVKDGEAFLIPDNKVFRTGSTDVTFNLPGKDGEIFLHKADSNCYEIRAMSEQGMLVEAPCQTVKITGITY
jgi:hypothetical protein